MFEPVGWSLENDDSYFRSLQVLLKLETLICCQECLEPSGFRQPEQCTVLSSGPASLLHCEGLEVRELAPQAFRKRFVNENQQA